MRRVSGQLRVRPPFRYAYLCTILALSNFVHVQPPRHSLPSYIKQQRRYANVAQYLLAVNTEAL